ncbi:MAG: hypothetical protein ABUR63_01685 [Verrucomicrobiota bacterium]
MPIAPRNVNQPKVNQPKVNRPKVNRLAWLVIAIPLGAGAIWALVPGDSPDGDQQTDDQNDHAQPPSRLERFGQAMDLLRKSRPDAPAGAAPSPDVLSVLFSGDDAPSRLGLVLTAVEANPTPPEQDPLWNDLVQGISSLWNADTMTWGLDLMFVEARPRARRAVVSSFARMVTATATSDRARSMTPIQRQTLIEHFIDLYQQAPSGQQPEVLAALRKIGATDAANVLEGKGLDSEEALEVNREHRKALAEGAAQVQAEERAQRAQARAQEQAQEQARQKEAQARALAAQQAQPAPAGAGQLPQPPSQEPTPQGQQAQAQGPGPSEAQGPGNTGKVGVPPSAGSDPVSN